MPTKSDRTFHVAFHRKIDVIATKAMHFQFAGGETHHDFRTTDHRDGARRLKPGVLEQCGDNADMASPSQPAIVHCDQHLGFALSSPSCQFLSIKQFAGAARTIQDDKAAVFLAIGQERDRQGVARAPDRFHPQR